MESITNVQVASVKAGYQMAQEELDRVKAERDEAVRMLERCEPYVLNAPYDGALTVYESVRAFLSRVSK